MADGEARAGRARGLLYGRRKGPKLRGAQAALLQSLLPQVTLDLPANPATAFAIRPDALWLEVGFGAGEHLAALARAHPGHCFLGAEPFINGVAKLLAKIQAEPALQQRIRLHVGDARDILAALPQGALDAIAVLFPDPWPKTRHHKRRFLQGVTLDAIARALKPGGELRFASDDQGYVSFALERLIAHPAFTWTATRAQDWRARPPDWPPTRYEAKEIRGKPSYFRFIRKPAA